MLNKYFKIKRSWKGDGGGREGEGEGRWEERGWKGEARADLLGAAADLGEGVGATRGVDEDGLVLVLLEAREDELVQGHLWDRDRGQLGVKDLRHGKLPRQTDEGARE